MVLGVLSLWAQESFAASKCAQPVVRSIYQPWIRPCDISSQVTYPWRGGVKYERYFHAMLRLNCACAKSTSWYLSAYFYRHARAYLTCPRVLGRGYLPHCTSRPLVAPARGSARLDTCSACQRLCASKTTCSVCQRLCTKRNAAARIPSDGAVRAPRRVLELRREAGAICERRQRMRRHRQVVSGHRRAAREIRYA